MRTAVIYVAIGAFIILVLALLSPRGARADHGVARCGGTGVAACLSTSSPFVNRVVKPGGEVTWCLDARASQYPGFRVQVESVTQRMAQDLGLTQRQVPMPVSRADQSCIVRHEMPETHACGGCGAWIYTQNFPVLIEYNWRTGYSRFDSTIGHELPGHGACLIDEHYNQQAFRSWVLDHIKRGANGELLGESWLHGAPTSMDSGTPYLPEYTPLGIWYLTPYDLDRCEETLGRDLGPPPPCGISAPNPDGARFDSCTATFIFGDGWNFNLITTVWTRPDGLATWINCNKEACWSLVKDEWAFAGTHVYYDNQHFFPPLAKP